MTRAELHRPEGPGAELWEFHVAVHAQSSRYLECEPSWRLPPRSSPDYQLWLIAAGEAAVQLDDPDGFTLGPASAMLLPPGVTHAVKQHPARHLRLHVVHFTALALGMPAVLLWQPRAVSDIPPHHWNRLVGCAEEIREELDDGRDGARLLADAATARLLGLLQRYAPGCNQHDVTYNSRQATIVAKVLDHIRQHYAGEVRLQHLARAAAVSPKHLDVTFRRVTGVTPSQYLRRYRIEQAKHLLGETDAPVREIADAVGFTDSYYFSRAFRRSEGLSPIQFRSALRTDLLR